MIEIYNNLQEQIAKLIVSSNIHFYQGNNWVLFQQQDILLITFDT